MVGSPFCWQHKDQCRQEKAIKIKEKKTTQQEKEKEHDPREVSYQTFKTQYDPEGQSPLAHSIDIQDFNPIFDQVKRQWKTNHPGQTYDFTAQQQSLVATDLLNTYPDKYGEPAIVTAYTYFVNEYLPSKQIEGQVKFTYFMQAYDQLEDQYKLGHQEAYIFDQSEADKALEALKEFLE